MKNSFLFFLFLFLSFTFVSASPYSVWLQQLQREMERESIQTVHEMLKDKPSGNDADYDVWLSFFEEMLQYGRISGSKHMDFVLAAKPEIGARYPVFLKFIERIVEETGPVMELHEDKAWEYIKKAKPDAVPEPLYSQFLSDWSRFYGQLKDDFGVLDTSEQKILGLVKEIKPEKKVSKAQDPLYWELNRILSHNSSEIAGLIAENDYVLGNRMVEILQAFYMRVQHDWNKSKDPRLKKFLDAMESFG